MKKVLLITLGIFIFFAIYGGMNYYVYKNIVAGIEIAGITLILFRLSFWVLGTAYIGGQILKKVVNTSNLTYLGSVWMGILGISMTIFFIRDLSAWLLPIDNDLYLVAYMIILIMIIYSFFKVKAGPKIKCVDINRSKNNGKSISIIHLADIHLGVMTSEKWLEDVVKKINDLNGDMVVITGDMVDDSFHIVKMFAPQMASIKARIGVFAVAGNHEHYQGIDNFYEFCKAANITILDNESIMVDDKINLIGIDDNLVKEGTLYQKVNELIGKDNDSYNVLLLHQPVGFNKLSEMGVHLQLSGHTHKGQLPPLNLLVPIKYPYSYGLHSLGNSHIYTTSGTGTWGPPMRLFTNSEIVKINVS